MAKNILVKTNIFVCTIILAGFALTALQNYTSTRRLYMEDMEHISSLTTEGIYYRLESIFAKPVNVSLTMANDNFLIDFLAEEPNRLDDDEYVQTMGEYLEAYRAKYDYDSVFLVSTNTNRYYNFSGIDRVLHADNPENFWYYDFVESGIICSLNVDNDEAASNEITVFVNCAIRDKTGTIGIVGVGFRIDNLQALLREYEKQFGVQTFLISEQGYVEISTDLTGYEYVDHFTICGYPELKEEILSSKDARSYWLEEEKGRNYVVAQYIPDLSWYLIVENDTRLLDAEIQQQLTYDMIIVSVIVLVAIVVITSVIRGFKRNVEQLIEENQLAFRNATEELFDNIYEINITTDMPVGKSAGNYFLSLGLTENTSYSETVNIFAQTQVCPEHRDEYIRIFSPENILTEFSKGVTSLQYEFQSSTDGKSYKWSRINVNIYRNKEDDSVHAFTYRQDIESEKRTEIEARTDSLTGLFNKITTERYIKQLLAEEREQLFGFIIFDIDDFKQINDKFGHSCGDEAIAQFANALRKKFRRSDIIGRIGGDEFVVFLPIPSATWVQDMAREFSESLDIHFENEQDQLTITTSIGISISPIHGSDFETLYKNADAALYTTKGLEKNGYTIYTP